MRIAASEADVACICCTTRFLVEDLKVEGFFVTYVSVDAMAQFLKSLDAVLQG